MTEIDLNALSIGDLRQLKKDVEKALSTIEQRRKQEALAAAEAAAKGLGFSLSELTRSKSPRSINAPKFRHPENSDLTWSGRGRRPDWFNEALAGGAKEDDLLI